MTRKARINQSKNPDSAVIKACIQVALSLAAKKNWHRIDLEDVIRAAKVPPQTARRLIPRKKILIRHIFQHLHAEAMNRFHLTHKAGHSWSGAWNDLLFDLIMSKMDVFQKHRILVINIIRYLPEEIDILPALASDLTRNMRAVLKACEYNDRNNHFISIFFAKMLYLAVLYTWMQDETPDLSKTMAALDRSIRLFQRFSQKCYE